VLYQSCSEFLPEKMALIEVKRGSCCPLGGTSSGFLGASCSTFISVYYLFKTDIDWHECIVILTYFLLEN